MQRAAFFHLTSSYCWPGSLSYCFMHLDCVLCHSDTENSVKVENSATCYLASEGITACRMTAILLDGLGSVLSCGSHWNFVFFQNSYASYHECLRCVDYWVACNLCIYSSLVLL